MDNSIEHFDEAKNLARVAAGLKGGPFYNNPVTLASRSIVDGYPEVVSEKLQAGAIPQPSPIDPWGQRNAKMKY